MAKKDEKKAPMRIVLENGKEYTLEFNRETVVYAEEYGFKRTEIFEKMMANIPKLFHCAFLMHHPNITQDETDKILFEELEGLTDDEMERLSELFLEPYKTLVNEQATRKNSRATVRM